MRMYVPRLFRILNQVKEAVNKPPLALDKDSKFVYTAGADVMATWKKYGFVPPSEVRTDYLFGKNREARKGE
jgi:hypothetical protein